MTRPRPESIALGDLLEKQGFSAVLAPMFNIVPVPQQFDLDGVQALLFTSRNGVEHFSDQCARRDIPVFTVGMATAGIADQRGFSRVESAAGDAESLSRLVTARLNPADGSLLHLSGAEIRGNLCENLKGAGFACRRQVIYDAKPAEILPPSALTALETGTLDAAMFFSPRSAKIFIGLVSEAGLVDSCREIAAICLSDAVIAEAEAIDWRVIIAAKLPQQGAMIDALEAII